MLLFCLKPIFGWQVLSNFSRVYRTCGMKINVFLSTVIKFDQKVYIGQI